MASLCESLNWMVLSSIWEITSRYLRGLETVKIGSWENWVIRNLSWHVATASTIKFYSAKSHICILHSSNSAFNKIRRHLSVGGNNDVDSMNYDSNSYAASTRPIKNTMKRIRNYATYSSSELRIRVSELHADANGRLEISCVSTIPNKVGKNETYADFQVFSVRGKA